MTSTRLPGLDPRVGGDQSGQAGADDDDLRLEVGHVWICWVSSGSLPTANLALCANNAVHAAPIRAKAQPAPNAHDRSCWRATRPSAIGPNPRPRSMNAEAVPAAAPRSPGVAVAKIAAKNAGVEKVTPTAITTTPVSRPASVCHPTSTANPAAIATREPAASGNEGNRSGTLAKATRHTTITPP